MDFTAIEHKWQQRWYKDKIYEAKKEKGMKFFIHFAYPGISGYLHVGHMRGFTYSDVIARYMRMTGHDVMFPAGFHATGLPAVSLAKKVARKDESMLSYLRTNGCPEEVINRLSDPEEVVKYFSTIYIEDYWKKFGFLIDYSRQMTTISLGYNKFIQWQFRKLNEKGYLIQKQHFAPFCINCGPVAVDKSETDISEGGDAEILEFTLLKFTFGHRILPAATLRPETVFGVTNMWVNDKIEYVIVKVGNEEWIVSEHAAKKIAYQMNDVVIVGRIHGNEMVGKTCKCPLVNREIPIYPASFADPTIATGVVMSVPAHAPYDYIALLDIGMPVEPITIIEVPGYTMPAREIVERMHIKSQMDRALLEEATQLVYKDEFHNGNMNGHCGEYAGMKVNDAKERIKSVLLEKNMSAALREFSKPVICRCGGDVIIKQIPDQWFIKYSDCDLTERSIAWTSDMNIYPNEYKEELPSILTWFNDRACIRQGSWLGTSFPFDEKWIIEPISDSTLYPAYYIISRYVNEGMLLPQEMDDAFFDYVYLGIGEPKNDLWKTMREECKYWYPVDINLGGKEHKTVHFPVFIMNHVAVMPDEMQPQGIFVNWWITQKAGVKISKSKGGAEPIPDAALQYGVDALRLYYCHVGSPFVDIEWDGETVEQYKKRLLRLCGLFEQLTQVKGGNTEADAWFFAVFNEKIAAVRKAMGMFELRSATNILFFDFLSLSNWYLRRGGKNRDLLCSVLNAWVRALTPFTPHLAEEMWEMLGNSEFISCAEYPDAGEVDQSILKAEDVLIKTMADIEEIKKVAKLDPKRIYIYIAPQWKWDIAERAAMLDTENRLSMKTLMEEIKSMNVDMKQASLFATKLITDMKKEKFIKIDLKTYMKKARDFMEKELNATVEIYDTENCYDPAGKCRHSMPFKPAIYIE